MPRKEGVKSIDIPIGESAREVVKEAAGAAGYRSMADYVRDLIRRDVESRGLSFDDGLTEWGKGRKKEAAIPAPEAPKRKKKTE